MVEEAQTQLIADKMHAIGQLIVETEKLKAETAALKHP